MPKRKSKRGTPAAAGALGLALVIALAGCSLRGTPGADASAGAPTDTAPPTPGTNLSACEVVTANDVKRVLMAARGKRVDVAEGELAASPNELSPGHATCTYRGDDWGRLEVDLTPEDGAGFFEAALAGAPDAQLLEIGDGAFWSQDTERGFFRKGSVTVMLHFSDLPRSAEVRAATVAVGRRAVNKL